MASGGRYIPGEEPALTQRLDDFLGALASRLGADAAAGDVRCLILSGGYGRGEGGVFRDGEGRAALYNDLEFYLVLRGHGSAAASAWSEREAAAGTAELGIDVEFKLIAAAALEGARPSMFYYDLASASRTVWGDLGFVAALPAALRDAAMIPAAEAARLLFNRGSGLFFSRCALEAGDERVSNGFVARNHAKARLALGDAVLALNGRYHFSCVERGRRMRESLVHVPPEWERVRAWHEQGVEFKLHPRHLAGDPAALGVAQRELVGMWLSTFLWLEGRRLGTTFGSATDYAGWGGRLFPRENPGRAIALHLRDRLRRGGALPGWSDYPRAALMRALILLIGGGATGDRHAARLIGADAGAGLEAAYRRWWHIYN